MVCTQCGFLVELICPGCCRTASEIKDLKVEIKYCPDCGQGVEDMDHKYCDKIEEL